MKIFVTGGTGFIGSYIVIELLRNGHEVTTLARNPGKISGFSSEKNLKIVQGEITEYELLDKLVKGFDAIIHVALNYTKNTAWEVVQDDTFPTIFLASKAAEKGVKHFIYTSSTAVNDNVYMLEEEKISDLNKQVFTNSKPHPTTFYGATKAASEIFLTALSYQSNMRVNIVRPGYTFGNPVVEGAPTQGDTRFHNMVNTVLRNEPVTVTKHDGTQFIFAGDLAKIFIALLYSDLNRRTFFGLSNKFITWEEIAFEAIIRFNSKSRLIIDDKGYSEDPVIFDVSEIKDSFDLDFNPFEKIIEHLDYYKNLELRL